MDGCVDGFVVGAEEGAVEGWVVGAVEGFVVGTLEGAVEGTVDGHSIQIYHHILKNWLLINSLCFSDFEQKYNRKILF